MPPTYYCILTNLGLAKFAAAASGGSQVQITHFAVGDSAGNYYEPLATQVALVSEKWRDGVNRVYVSPNNASWAVIEAIIPAADGGFDIRESAVFDAAGDMIGVGKYPLTTKPAPGSGSEKDLYVRMILQVANAAAVTQQIDPSLVLATQQYVDSRDWRESVRAATTAPIAALAGGAPSNLDGVALANGDRVLVKDQAAAAQNGIYIVQVLGAGNNGTWVRALDADTALEVSANLTVAVEEGTANSDSIWMLLANRPITLGTTGLLFKRLITQAELDSHANSTAPHSATSAATADRIIVRDGNGRAKVAAPSAADDIARKDTVDTHAALTAPHSATAANVGDRIVMRDSSGDIHCRLLRSEYAAGGLFASGYFLGQNAVGAGGVDNYARPTPLSSLPGILGFAASHGNPGYDKLPGGLIIQSGSNSLVNGAAGATLDVGLATSFSWFVGLVVGNNTPGTAGDYDNWGGFMLNAWSIRLFNYLDMPVTLSWWAFGY